MPEKTPKSSLAAPFAFSQSSLQDYDDCNRRFQLRYIQQLQWPAVETAPVLENERRQIEGQQFHRMVQQYLLGLPVEKLTHIANNSGSQNLARWWLNFITARETSLANLSGQVFYPELSLSAPIGMHRAIAKYDLIAVKDNRATIYDWKTYHKRPQDAVMKGRLQTTVYLNLLIKAGSHLNEGQAFAPESVEMVYWYADFPSEPAKFAYDVSRYEHEWEGLSALIGEVSAKQSFPLTEDEKKCGFCLYRSYCERGVIAIDGDAESETSANTNWDVNLEQIQEIEF